MVSFFSLVSQGNSSGKMPFPFLNIDYHLDCPPEQIVVRLHLRLVQQPFQHLHNGLGLGHMQELELHSLLVGSLLLVQGHAQQEEGAYVNYF
jgi:hypothetical protein